MGLAAKSRIRSIPPTRSQTRLPLTVQLTRYRWYLIVPALYCALTIVLLWPLVRGVRSAVADTIGDPLLNAWTLRWVQHALVTNPLHLYDGNMFAPNPRSLAFSEALLPQAIMAWPMWLITHDSLLAYNLSVLVTYPLCAIAMYALCRALGANRTAAFLAGLLYAFAPFRMDSAAHLQVLSMQWMPLAILAVVRFMQSRSQTPASRLLRGACVTLTFTLVALASVYYAIMFATGFVAFLIVEGIRQRRQFFSRAGIGLLIALGIAGGVVAALDVPYFTMRQEQGITRTLDESYDDAAHADSYLTVTPGSIIWKHVLPISGSEHSALFPGALLALLALIGLGQLRRPWVAGIGALGLVGFVLSFGPTLGDKEAGIPLPYRVLYAHVVGYQGLRGPDRFATLVLLTLAVLAALGATWAWERAAARWPTIRRYALACAVIVALIGVADVAARLLPTVPVDRSAAMLAPYQWLATQKDTGTIAEFPVARTDQLTAFYSTYHWHPVLWGHSGFIPAATYHLRGQFVGRKDYPTLTYLQALADMGVRTVLIHRDMYGAEELGAIDEAIADESAMLHFETHAGNTDIYALSPNPSAAPLGVTATFATNPTGNFGSIVGTLSVTNPGPQARDLFVIGKFDLAAIIRDASGKVISNQTITLQPPAVILAGTTRLQFSINLPTKAGQYTLSLLSADVPALQQQAPAPVLVIDAQTLPHLTLAGRHVTSPPLYTPGEPVAMWMTEKDGRTVPLPDTTAKADGTLDASVPDLPADATQIVAHGKTSGLELWVAVP